jgi:peptide/nickel transport system substrate-binding protein
MLLRAVRPLIVLLLVVVLVSVPLAVAQEDSSVTIMFTSDPLTFDPHGRLGSSGPTLAAYIYDTLLIQNEQGALEPGIAVDWQVADGGQAITFMLRDDVVFSNGAPLNADAVIFTFERLQAIGQRSLIFSEIANISAFEKVDEYTVRFVLAEPSASLLSALTYAYAGILEPGAVEAAGEDYGLTPVGSGPYMLAAWTPDSTLSLVRNPQYAGHRTLDTTPGLAVETINVVFSRDQQTRVNALLSGEVDVAYLSAAGVMAPVVDNPDFQVFEALARGVIFAGFNTAREPFSDAALRRAVAQTIQKDDILTIAADGLGQVIHQPLPPVIFGFDAALDAEALPYDLNAARDLVTAAGYGPANPLDVSLITLSNPTYQNIATVIQAELSEIGINVQVESLDYGALLAAANEGAYDMLVLRYDWNDPDILRLYLSTDSIGAANRFNYSNADLDALLAAGRQESDPDARAAHYADAMRIIMDDVPLIPLYTPMTNVVINSRLQQVEVLHSYIILENAALAN